MRLIDSHALLKQFTHNSQGQRIPERDCDNFPIEVSIAEVKRVIRSMPTISPKRGEWKTCKVDHYNGYDTKYKCSQCENKDGAKRIYRNAEDWPDRRYPFCPLCGADMGREGEG